MESTNEIIQVEEVLDKYTSKELIKLGGEELKKNPKKSLECFTKACEKESKDWVPIINIALIYKRELDYINC